METDANTYYLNQHLSIEESAQRLAAKAHIIINDKTLKRLTHLDPENLLVLFTELDSTNPPAKSEQLFNDLTCAVSSFYANETVKNALHLAGTLKEYLYCMTYIDEENFHYKDI